MTDDLESRIHFLEAANRRVVAQNRALKSKLEFLRRHRALAAGIRGENLVAHWINAARSSPNSTHDLITRRGQRIEVKFSALGTAVRSRQASPDSATLRWSWNKILGESGRKEFDYLFLVGEADARHASKYRNESSPYVIFAVPFSETEALTNLSGRHRIIQLTTNPHSARARGRELFDQYQVSEANLRRRFDL